MPSPLSKLVNPTDFIDKDVFELLGLANLDQKEKDSLLDLFVDTVTNRVMARILDGLDESKQAEVERLVAEEAEQPFAQFLTENTIDVAQYFAEEAVLYKVEIINLVSGQLDGTTA